MTKRLYVIYKVRSHTDTHTFPVPTNQTKAMSSYADALFLPFTKNFTALIPGTTVEILDQDSKNVIQLIVAAYNVSRENPSLVPSLLVCTLSEREHTQNMTQKDMWRKVRRGRCKGRHGRVFPLLRQLTSLQLHTSWVSHLGSKPGLLQWFLQLTLKHFFFFYIVELTVNLILPADTNS